MLDWVHPGDMARYGVRPMKNDGQESGRPRDRRQFFQHGLLRVLTPLADYIQDRVPALMPRPFLRPPGALAEKQFLERCYRCGNCVEICPANAIRRLVSEDASLNETPYVDPDLAACVVCENMECTRVCPSGALQRVVERCEIQMGLARLRAEVCLRTAGQSCDVCVQRCPIGQTAIRIDGTGRVEIDAAGCVGCGLCQNLCPSNPRAITVEPL